MEAAQGPKSYVFRMSEGPVGDGGSLCTGIEEQVGEVWRVTLGACWLGSNRQAGAVVQVREAECLPLLLVVMMGRHGFLRQERGRTITW